MIVNQVLHISICALFFLLIAYKFVDLLRKPSNPAMWGISGALAGFCFGLTIGVDLVFKAMDRGCPVVPGGCSTSCCAEPGGRCSCSSSTRSNRVVPLTGGRSGGGSCTSPGRC